MKYLYIILIIKHFNLYPGNCSCFTAGAPTVHAPGDARSGYHDTRPRATCTNTEFHDGKFTTTQVFLFTFHLLFQIKRAMSLSLRVLFRMSVRFSYFLFFLIVLTSACYILVYILM